MHRSLRLAALAVKVRSAKAGHFDKVIETERALTLTYKQVRNDSTTNDDINNNDNDNDDTINNNTNNTNNTSNNLKRSSRPSTR